MTSPIIAEAPSGCCFTGFKHEGTPVGHEISLGGMQTYISKLSKPTNKILLFFSDIMGPFYVNNKLLQDHFASNGASSDFSFGMGWKLSPQKVLLFSVLTTFLAISFPTTPSQTSIGRPG
jgi:hypothetical protein